MNSSKSEFENGKVIEVNCWTDRWQVYRRLQELDIPCSCGVNQPLRVQINNLNHGLQLSSVLKQVNGSRQELLESLECCWHQVCTESE